MIKTINDPLLSELYNYRTCSDIILLNEYGKLLLSDRLRIDVKSLDKKLNEFVRAGAIRRLGPNTYKIVEN